MYETIDTIIMGKRTYDYVVEHMETFPYVDKNVMFSLTQKKVQMNTWSL